jgi:nucleotide-binding universal stress UspA family protein
MNRSRNILVAVDDSEASDRAVTYVGNIIGGREGYSVRLLHILPPLPPALLEVGGSENPDIEQREEMSIHAQQAAWLAQAEEAARPTLERATSRLRQANIPAQAIATQCVVSINGQAMVTDILDAAEANQCGTIVVGRESFHGLQALLAHHVGDELIAKGRGVTVWIVE